MSTLEDIDKQILELGYNSSIMMDLGMRVPDNVIGVDEYKSKLDELQAQFKYLKCCLKEVSKHAKNPKYKPCFPSIPVKQGKAGRHDLVFCATRTYGAAGMTPDEFSTIVFREMKQLELQLMSMQSKKVVKSVDELMKKARALIMKKIEIMISDAQDKVDSVEQDVDDDMD